MEASVAVTGGGGEGTAETAEQASPAVDFGPVLQHLDSLGSQIGERVGALEQQFQQFTGDGEDEIDPTVAALAQMFGQDPEIEEQQVQTPPQIDPAKLVEALQGTMDSRLQEALQPLTQQLGALTARTNADMLQAELPELKNPEVAKAVVEGAMALAQAAGLDPNAGRSPDVVRAVYKAMRYDQIAAGEVPVSELQHQGLEAGGGASPRGGNEPDIVAQIKAARGGNAFWGT